jgi:hypothetical protein
VEEHWSIKRRRKMMESLGFWGALKLFFTALLRKCTAYHQHDWRR